MAPLRIAAIEFLNAAPLMWGLEADPRFTLAYTLPAACADALRDGTADLGVIPVIELARIPGLVGLAGLGVAAHGGGEGSVEVRSILLISRCPAPAIRTVALDRASRTSAALVQVLLRHFFGAQFETRPGNADWRRGLEGADALLMIGDPALRLRISGEATAAGHHVYDLAQVWQEWTGLPFVFALWGIRREAFQGQQGWLAERLQQSLEQGLEHREDLVKLWAPRLGIAAEEVRRYLANNVTYRLTPAHLRALQQFFALAAADGLLDSPALPELVDRTGVPV